MAKIEKDYTDKHDYEVSLASIQAEGRKTNMMALQQVWVLDGQIQILGEGTPAGLMLRQTLQISEMYLGVINGDDDELKGQVHWATKLNNVLSNILLKHAEHSKKEVKIKKIVEVLKKYKEMQEQDERKHLNVKQVITEGFVGEEELFGA